MAEKIRVILKRKNLTLAELAERLDISKQNLNSKMKRDNFSQNELKEIARALEIEYVSKFILEDNTEI
ncbi:transcriptional regulator [[Bacillus] sp. KCTC 13219]|nr:transcriptional regulator [[Bacillus] sp. KCTC 13219]